MARAAAAILVATFCAALLAAQTMGPCSCGANPPGPPPDRVLKPYAGEPEDMRPFVRFTKPYYEHYTKLVEYNGAAREVPAPEVSEVRIGFLGPIENHPDGPPGRMMLNGATMAIDEANAHGGYCGKPFKLIVHNDSALWGSSSNEVVKMCYDERVWAILGSISGDSTHIALRVALRAEVPIVNSAATDPTLPETVIPWYFTVIQDDRVQGFTLARRIYTELGLKRIALLRVNDRYGRFGVMKFRDASRRLGHPVVIEQKYMPGTTDFSRQLRVIAGSQVDGVVLWADAGPAATILKQMRAMGMSQPVFGGFRVVSEELLRSAGQAAEGLEAVFPYDPTRDDPAWLAFNRRFEERWKTPPDAFASLAYDSMRILLESICRAGLNRGRIRDALTGLESYKGVTGEMAFDPNCKNIVPMYLATVRDGRFVYRRATMDAPYANLGDSELLNEAPPVQDSERRIVLFGPSAADTAARLRRDGFEIVPVASDTPWGKASTELVRLVYEGHSVALLATDRTAAHLAAQIAAKTFVPTLAISSDRSLTSANIPWVFRVPPQASPEKALDCLIQAVAKVGPNRARVRDHLAAGHGSIRFDSHGEPLD